MKNIKTSILTLAFVSAINFPLFAMKEESENNSNSNDYKLRPSKKLKHSQSKIEKKEKNNTHFNINSPHSEEDLLYSTLKIVCNLDNKRSTCGSGFIFSFKESLEHKIQEKVSVNFKNETVSKIKKKFSFQGELREFCKPVNFVEKPYLVTNKHVVKDVISADLTFHFTDGSNGTYNIGNKNSPFYKSFIFHESEDLCAMPLHGVFDQINNLDKNKRIFYHSLSRFNLFMFETVEVLPKILMVGYPIGISDDINNLPIIRKGTTSSNVRTDFQGKPQVLIDMACFPGSSGSPVFLSQESENNVSTPKLLGILWGGPQYPFQGNIIYTANEIFHPKTSTAYTQSQIPMHLGYVIKSTELDELQKKIYPALQGKIYPTLLHQFEK